MRTHTATYSPDDNKLRLYPAHRLDGETYARVKSAGFRWAPRRELFVAPSWSPEREDLLIELAGEIGDEDTSLVERAERRAERFEEYAEKRVEEADRARKAVASIADNIPFGQPILVGHHSGRHARRDAEKIESGMRKTIKLWEASKYWQSRAAGALRDAKYKERPDVRARRIKTIEAEQRKVAKTKRESTQYLKLWTELNERKATNGDGTPATARDIALHLADTMGYVSMCFPLATYPRDPPASQYEGAMSIWSALNDNVITAEQARAILIPTYQHNIARCERWLAHFEHRLTYERAMLAEAGGTAADQTGPMVGGAVRCWASPRGGWS